MAVTADRVLAFLGRSGDDTLAGTVEQAIPIVTTMVRAYTRGNGFDVAPEVRPEEPREPTAEEILDRMFGPPKQEGRASAEPLSDLDSVIMSAAARMATNPGGIQVDETAGPFTHSLKGAFVGWTLAELAVLNRYRKRAQ